MSVKSLVRTVALLLSLCLLLASCNDSSDTNGNLPEYTPETTLALSLGESIAYTAADADGSGIVSLPDGRQCRVGDFKPAFATLAAELGLKLSDSNAEHADIIVDTVENLNSRGSHGRLVNLYTYSGYTANLSNYLAHHLDVRTAVSYEGNRKYIYAAPIVCGENVIRDLVFLDRAAVTYLLDGDGEFVGDTAGALDLTDLAPIMPTSGVTTVTLYDSDGVPTEIGKNYSAAGNPITTQHILDELGECDLATATNAFRDYIDNAYGGLYSSCRSDLFFGQNAVYDADELVVLITLLGAYNAENCEKRDTGRTNSEISTILFGDTTYTDRVDTLVAAGLLDCIVIADSDALVPDGLVPVLPPYSPRTVIPEIAPEEEGSSYNESTDNADPVPTVVYERTVTVKPAFTGYGIAIVSSVATDGRRLSAALAFINYIFSSTASYTLGYSPDGFFNAEGISATLAHARTLGLSPTAYARRFVGSGILAVDRRLMRAFLSEDADAALDAIHLAIEQGNATVKN